jgi:hypothetical protein
LHRATIGTVPNPDPVSVAFEATARRLLERAYAQRNSWISVRLADPTIRQRTRFAQMGIGDLLGPDNATATGGKGLDAKTRWARALIRALYRLHKNEYGRRGALRIEVGRHIPASPQFDPANPSAGGLPPARQFRLMIDRGGSAAMRAVRRQPDRDRIYDDEGRPTLRWADPAKRDWA